MENEEIYPDTKAITQIKERNKFGNTTGPPKQLKPEHTMFVISSTYSHYMLPTKGRRSFNSLIMSTPFSHVLGSQYMLVA